MPDLLLYGDTVRSPALRHEIPIAIMDPFLYAEIGGRPHVLASILERDRIASTRPDAELVETADLGFHELLKSGRTRDEVELEMAARMAERIGVREATVDFGFPLGLARRLQADGVKLEVD